MRSYTTQSLRFSFVLITSALILFALSASAKKSTGAHPGTTGAPGEATCKQPGCHADATVQSGDGVNTLMFNGLKTLVYEPDSVYHLLLRVHEAESKRFGFEIVAVDDNNNNAGTLIVPFSVKLARIQILHNNDKLYATHVSGSIVPIDSGTNEWEIDWQAPSSDVGQVHFYYATNASNANNNALGDKVYLSSSILRSKTSEVFLEGDKPGIRSARYLPNQVVEVECQSSELTGEVVLSLHDLGGRTVATVPGHLNGSNLVRAVLPSALVRGPYLLRLQSQLKTLDYLLMVQNR